MMVARTRAVAITLSLVLGGCAIKADAERDVPATVPQPTAASRAEIQKIVSAALGAPVTLADDVFTRDNTLSIERTALRDDKGRRIEVRERNPPELFRLVKHGSQCVLIHERTQSRTLLKATRCE